MLFFLTLLIFSNVYLNRNIQLCHFYHIVENFKAEWDHRWPFLAASKSVVKDEKAQHKNHTLPIEGCGGRIMLWWKSVKLNGAMKLDGKMDKAEIKAMLQHHEDNILYQDNSPSFFIC